jgi:bifunctional non-homologous end joining protein LigD
VIVRLEGERVRGRYAIFRTRDDDWLIHRMDPPEPGREPMPERIEPMKATLSALPPDEDRWGFEIKWDGVRAIAYCEPGRLRLESRNLREVTGQYPEVRGLIEELGARKLVLDGEIVAFDEEGRPSFQLLQRRMHVGSEAEVRRRMERIPVSFMIFDLLYVDGRSLLGAPYEERRRELEAAHERYQRLPPERQQQLQVGIPHAELALIEGSGHLPFVEAQERFLDAVRAFLARAPVGPSRSANTDHS